MAHGVDRRTYLSGGRSLQGGAMPTISIGNLQDAEIRLLHVDSSSGVAMEPYWRLWTSLTGGAYTTLGDDQSLSEVILELLSLI